MHKTSIEYRKGVECFLKFSLIMPGVVLIVCSCNKCKVVHNHRFIKEEVAHHLMLDGFGATL